MSTLQQPPSAPRRAARTRRTQLIAAVLVVAALLAVNGPPAVGFVSHEYHQWQINRPAYKQRYGHWTNLPVPASMRINAVHTIVLNDGKVLLMAGSGNDAAAFRAGHFESLLWNPANDRFTKIPTPYDMFCSGHFILPDGRVLIAGGTARYEVLANRVRYAAGVMTITNHNLGPALTVPKGTVFRAPGGQLYRATTAATVPSARAGWARVGGRRVRVTNSTTTPLWVTAEQAGHAPVIRTNTRFSMPSLPPSLTAGMAASAFSITRDAQNYWGSDKAYVFDPSTERYQRVDNMHLARWYPTLVGLRNGSVLAVSGLDQFGRIISGNSESFDARTGRWTLRRHLTHAFPTYPALFLMPNGQLFYTGASTGYGPDTSALRQPGIWNPVTNRFRAVGGMRDVNETDTAGSVLLAPAQAQRYAIIGGGATGESDRSTSRIDIADLRARHPRWRPAGHLFTRTRYPEVVLTPTDGVIISGGSRDYRGEHGTDNMQTDMYMPMSGRISHLAAPLVGRDYHAEGVLLPDGRVLTVGGNPLYGDRHDDTVGYFEKRISIFSPPYLYHGPRPRIGAGPTRVSRGQTVTFASSDPAQIVKARLIHPSSVTHVTDVQQRSIALGLRRVHGHLALTVPRGAGLVPSGWYMLFVDNRAGVPSVARWLDVR